MKGGGGGTKSCHSLKGGAQNVLPCLEGGPQKVLDPRFSHFVAPLPVINDQSLILIQNVSPFPMMKGILL